MEPNIIPLITFALILFFPAILKKKHRTLFHILLITYTLSILCNLISGIYSDYRYDTNAMLYYTFAIFLFIYPYKDHDNSRVYDNLSINKKVFNYTSIFFILLNSAAIIWFFPGMISALTGDISEFRLSVNRLSAEISQTRFKGGIIETILVFSQASYFIPLSLFFYGLIKQNELPRGRSAGYQCAPLGRLHGGPSVCSAAMRRCPLGALPPQSPGEQMPFIPPAKLGGILAHFDKKLNLSLLFISSFSQVVFFSSQAGRTGIVRWLGCFLFNFILFKKYLSHRVKRQIIYCFVVVGTIVIAVIIIITVARFRQTNPIVAILDYLGQGITNFDYFYNSNYQDFHYGMYLFPLYYRVVNISGLFPTDLWTIYEGIMYSDPANWYKFASLLRELWYDFGRYGTIIAALFYVFLVRRVIKSFKYQIKMRNVILFYYLFSVPLYGVFSLPISGMPENFALLVIFLVRF